MTPPSLSRGFVRTLFDSMAVDSVQDFIPAAVHTLRDNPSDSIRLGMVRQILICGTRADDRFVRDVAAQAAVDLIAIRPQEAGFVLRLLGYMGTRFPLHRDDGAWMARVPVIVREACPDQADAAAQMLRAIGGKDGQFCEIRAQARAALAQLVP